MGSSSKCSVSNGPLVCICPQNRVCNPSTKFGADVPKCEIWANLANHTHFTPPPFRNYSALQMSPYFLSIHTVGYYVLSLKFTSQSIKAFGDKQIVSYALKTINVNFCENWAIFCDHWKCSFTFQSNMAENNFNALNLVWPKDSNGTSLKTGRSKLNYMHGCNSNFNPLVALECFICIHKTWSK